MLFYCPKCQQKYEDETQRFCVNDGARLHPQRSASDSLNSAGVFSGVLHKKGLLDDILEIKPIPQKLVAEQLLKGDNSYEKKRQAEKSAPGKVFTKLVKPEEIPSGQAQLGDRSLNPVGRVALSADNPNILLGQTVKGRYFIKARVSQTTHSIKYAAVDKLNGDKRIILRIFTGRLDGSDFSSKVFADERVALAHLNHPNIAKVIDSGELPEGNPFVVSDHVNGSSLKEMLARENRFDNLRAAKIIRQTANALSNAHQNSVLHRSLTTENIIVSRVISGSEQVKVTDFNIFSDKTHGDFNYQSPDQINGNSADKADDMYSLSVIAFQMLTGQMPFKAMTSKELYKAQRKGSAKTTLESAANIPQKAQAVLQKALSFEVSQRFSNIREFSDSLYEALTANNDSLSDETKIKSSPMPEDFILSLDSVLDEKKEPVKNQKQTTEIALSESSAPEKQTTEIALFEDRESENFQNEDQLVENEKQIVPVPFEMPDKIAVTDSATHPQSNDNEIIKPLNVNKFQITEKTDKADLDDSLEKTENPWERRSIEPPVEGGRNWTLLSILGIILLFTLTGFIFYYFANRPAEPKFVNVEPQIQQPQGNTKSAEQAEQSDIQKGISEIPPPPRRIEQPPNTLYFENTKENLSKELLKYYRSFYLYYPKEWKLNKFDKNRNKVDDKFIDISRNTADGIPIEQFMVSYYDSNGTLDLDLENFPEIIGKASEDIKNSPLPNYQLLDSGKINVNGWQAYEMKFQGEGTALSGEKIKLYGRRFYIPAARATVKKGLVVTLLATSLSKDVKTADELGEKGDLKTILSTFEPDQNY